MIFSKEIIIVEDFWPFPFCKDGQVPSATDHFASVTPKTSCTVQRLAIIFLLGYQMFVSELHHFWGIKVLFLYYVLSNMWGFFSPHTQKPLRNLNVHHLCFIKFPFSQTFFTEIKHFCPAWEDLPPKQGLSKPRVSWVDVDT